QQCGLFVLCLHRPGAAHHAAAAGQGTGRDAGFPPGRWQPAGGLDPGTGGQGPAAPGKALLAGGCASALFCVPRCGRGG
ncbi:hypothetical protein H5993_09355, partial [Lactobacillus alvi]